MLYKGGSKFWIRGLNSKVVTNFESATAWNPYAWPFKRKYTFLWHCLVCRTRWSRIVQYQISFCNNTKGKPLHESINTDREVSFVEFSLFYDQALPTQTITNKHLSLSQQGWSCLCNIAQVPHGGILWFIILTKNSVPTIKINCTARV